MAGKLLNTHSIEFTNETTSGTGGTRYYDLTGSSITFTTKEANSVFLLRADCQIYQTQTNNGGNNIHFVFNGVEYGGATAAAPGSATTQDAWSRFGNGAPTVGAGNMTRLWIVAPGLAANTSVTAYLRGGSYSNSSGTAYWNYGGYDNRSTFVIQEFSAS